MKKGRYNFSAFEWLIFLKYTWALKSYHSYNSDFETVGVPIILSPIVKAAAVSGCTLLCEGA